MIRLTDHPFIMHFNNPESILKNRGILNLVQ